MAIFNSELLVYRRVNLPQKSTGTDHVGPTVGGEAGPAWPRPIASDVLVGIQLQALNLLRFQDWFRDFKGLQGLKMQRWCIKMIKNGEMWPAALEGQRSVSELWERPGLNKAFFVELREKRKFHHLWRFSKSYGCYSWSFPKSWDPQSSIYSQLRNKKSSESWCRPGIRGWKNVTHWIWVIPSGNLT